MEWLSAEEKSRSMMPYLLDLPPLDAPQENTEKAKIVEIEEVKEPKIKSNKKKSKDIDSEKWHDQEIKKCDIKKQCIYDFSDTKRNTHIYLSDNVMMKLRYLALQMKNNCNKWIIIFGVYYMV